MNKRTECSGGMVALAMLAAMGGGGLAVTTRSTGAKSKLTTEQLEAWWAKHATKKKAGNQNKRRGDEHG